MIPCQDGDIDDVCEHMKEIEVEEECDGDMHHDGICFSSDLSQGDDGRE
jgi:hypothetical protein